MSTYGFYNRSSLDGSVIISGDFLNAYFIGKAVAGSTGSLSRFGDKTIYWQKYRTPAVNSTNPPIFFYHMPVGAGVLIRETVKVGSQWDIKFGFIGDGSSARKPLDVYCFLSSDYFAATSTYGMRLFAPDGVTVKFDSGWPKPMSVDDVQSWTVSEGATYVSAVLSKPAILFTPPWTKKIKSGGPDYGYIYDYDMQVERIGAQTFKLAVYNTGSWIGSGGASYNITYGNGEVRNVGIIDGARYD